MSLYQSIVPLDRHVHTRLKMRPPDNYQFAADTTVVPMLTTEFAPVAREYPIVFMRESDKEDAGFIPVALTGMPQGKNLFVDKDGFWFSRYVPAYVRRYPFVFVESAPDNFTVCIDPSARSLDENSGTALFEADGEPSNALKELIKSLGEYQQAVRMTRAFMKRMADAGIMMEANAKADLPDGRSFLWRGFWVVDETRFRETPEVKLKEWTTTGELGLVYAHLLSLGNLAELLRRHTGGIVNKVKSL